MSDNKIMVREALELGVDFDKYEELKEQADYIKEQLEIWEYQSREAIINVLKKNNAKSLQTAYRTYSLVGESVRQTVDSKRLKEDYPDLFNEYSKETTVKEHLMIKKRKD